MCAMVTRKSPRGERRQSLRGGIYGPEAGSMRECWLSGILKVIYARYRGGDRLYVGGQL